MAGNIASVRGSAPRSGGSYFSGIAGRSSRYLRRHIAILELDGKAALLAGTRRIGECVAQRLSMEGVNLAIAYRSSRAEAERLESSISGRVSKTCVVQGDLTSEEDVNRLVNEAADTLGGLNFVINLASDYPSATLDDMSGATWDRAMGSAKGSYLLCASAARIMRHNGLSHQRASRDVQ